MEHTVEVCPAWVEHHRVLVEAIGGDNLSHPVLVEAMVRGGMEVWEAVTSFCGAVMLAKDEAGRLSSSPPDEETPGATDITRRSPVTVGAGLRAVSSGSSPSDQD